MDYKNIGFKAGLEIHQQLLTGKLFCNCPSLLSDSFNKTIQRKLTLVSSETGGKDKAAVQEYKKNKIFEYQFSDNYACLVDLDEAPPLPPRKEAIEIAGVFAKMVNAEIIPFGKVMRKIVIDGSNTTGFQKTMLFAIGGNIPLKNKKIRLQTIVLEEDSARLIEKQKNKTTYRLDRLGIPLIEIATEPDLTNPKEVKECALKIGELLRLTCKVARGKGTIRQDLNISIKEGARVEIKGVQDLDKIDLFVEREVQRQLSLLKLKKEIPKEINSTPLKEISNIFQKTKSKLLLGKKVFAFGLKNFKNLLGYEIQPNRRFASELSDYLKAKTNLKGLIHSDELPAYNITNNEKSEVFGALNLNPEKDAFIFFIADKEESEKARNIVLERVFLAQEKIPGETRQAKEDGNSSFMRPLGGSDRMYPETDIPFVNLKQLTEDLKLPLSLQEREKLYKEKGLSENHIREMKLSNYACFFHSLLDKGYDAKLCATLLLDLRRKLERQNLYPKKEHFLIVLEELKTGKISKSQTEARLKQLLGVQSNIATTKADAIISPNKEKLKQEIKKILLKNKELIKEKQMRAFGPLMGDLKKIYPNLPPEVLISPLKEELSSFLKSLT